MRKLKFILFAFLFLPAISLFAAPFDMILVGDPILEDLRFLSIDTGIAILSFTPPLAPAEIRQFLDSIDESLLSSQGLEAYNRVEERLVPKAKLSKSNDIFSVFVNINSTLEARARTNTEIAWEPMYPKIEPMISFPLRFFFVDTLQLYIEPSITVTPEQYINSSVFGTNIPFGTDHFDSTMPLRTFLAAGGSWWNFQLGRDKIFFGTGNTGSISIADNSSYFEYARLSLFSSFFKYSLLINQMPLDITESLYAKYDPESANYLTSTRQRHFYLHRVDIRILDVLSIGLMEGLMAGNSPLEIRYLNPLMIFHSFYSSYEYETGWAGEKMGHLNGSFFSLELNWHIINSLSVYGQFVMNEFDLPFEGGDEPEPPNGLGFMAGVNYTHSFENWASIFFLEFFYTYPYLYMNSSPFASFIQMRKVFSQETRELYYFMGYPRDTIALTLGANFFKNNILNIGGRFSWTIKGEHDKDGLNWDWGMEQSHYNERTPTGIAEHKFISTLSARWRPLSYLTFNGSLAGIFSRNSRHIPGTNEFGMQGMVSLTLSY